MERRVKGEGIVYRRRDGRYMDEEVNADGKKRYITAKAKAEVRQNSTMVYRLAMSATFT
jgi:hypothetical protein